MKIKTGDTVMVIRGHYKKSTGEVKAVNPKTNKIIVEGVNMIKKALKPTQENPDGGIVEHEAPIDASNVRLYDKKAEKKAKKTTTKKTTKKKEEGKAE